MRILFYGAGVLGSLYAARLQEAGHDVSALARGQRLAELRKHGVVLVDAVTGGRTTAWVRTVERLSPEDAYDLVVVVVRKDQLSPVLDVSAESESTSDVVFMLNNASGPSRMVDAVGRERVILGFPGTGGWREGHEIRFVLGPEWLRRVQKTTFGELDGGTSPRLERIVGAFRDAGFPVAMSPDMDAWLKTHASAIVPMGNAAYAAGGDIHRLSHTRDALVLGARAIRENFEVLRALGVPVTPGTLRALGRLPEPLLVPLLGRLLDTKTAELAFAHAEREEMGQLAGELGELSRAASVPTPASERLLGYLDPAASQIPEGSARIPMDRRAAGVAALVAAVGMFAVLGLSRHR